MSRVLLLLLLLLPVPAQAQALWLSPGEPLTRAQASDLLLEALADSGIAQPLELVLHAPTFPLGNDADAPRRIAVQRLEHDERAGRLSAVLAVASEERVLGHVAVQGRVRALVDVPVLARPVVAGTIIAEADIDWRELPAERLVADAVLEADALIGSEARRRLPAGRPLRTRDLGPPRLVERGRAVVMIYERAGLRLTALGRALEDGGPGEVVVVANADSSRRVQGIVTGPDEVTVGSGGAP